jgi:tricorn protease
LLRSRGRWFRPHRPLNQPLRPPRPPTQAGPIKLARYPDYHAGRIAFSYMGDIWVAGEDGSNPVRLTVNTARETYPRFSPDGRWIAFSSNRFGNNDVFVVSASGGIPRQLTFFSGADDVVGWSRDGQQVLFRSAHGDGAFPNVATLYQVALTGGPEKPLPVDWGYYGDFSPDGKSLVFNRHPATWTRKHYRGSYAADLWIADLAQKTYRQLLPDDQFNRYWPMWGSDNNIYFVADPLPNEKNVKPGALEVYKSANNIYRVPAGGGQAVQLTKHTSGSLFWPSMSADGKTIVYEESFGVWKLDVASGRTTEIKIDVATDDKENEFEVATVQNEVDSFDLSPSGSARGHLGPRADHDESRPTAVTSRASRRT